MLDEKWDTLAFCPIGCYEEYYLQSTNGPVEQIILTEAQFKRILVLFKYSHRSTYHRIYKRNPYWLESMKQELTDTEKKIDFLKERKERLIQSIQESELEVDL